MNELVYLIEEDIFPVPTFRSEVFEVAILIYAVLLTQLLPELATDFEEVSARSLNRRSGSNYTAIAALACLNGDYLSSTSQPNLLVLGHQSPTWAFCFTP